jgi:hypothetical protein
MVHVHDATVLLAPPLTTAMAWTVSDDETQKAPM